MAFAYDDLEAFGATPESVLGIDGSPNHRHLDYLDLPALPSALPRVSAVVEMGGRPVLYVVRGPVSDGLRDRMAYLLAQRGAADHLGVLEPGILTVWPLLKARRNVVPTLWDAQQVSARSCLPGIAFGAGSRANAPGTALHLHDSLVALLIEATKVISEGGATAHDALSLVGRALFLRFLIDRRLVTDSDLAALSPSAPSLIQAMDTASGVRTTSEWLDRTFNGNLLPLPGYERPSFWRRLDEQVVCKELGKILAKSETSGQLRFDWDSLDFSHIPVGLLSQVYEAWCHHFEKHKAVRESVWYTPRAIAEFVVDEAFCELQEPHRARVLDPAVGAGVFLVAAFRRLVAARWERDGVRPSRRIIRDILYKQLSGFEVSEASLRLTALALYLTSLELEPKGPGADRLRFEDLRQKGVLTDVRTPEDIEAERAGLPLIGSLSSRVSSHHDSAYDVVLGNPPWTAWSSDDSSRDVRVRAKREQVEQLVSPIVQRATAQQSASFDMVDFAPDLPFLWRAMQWAKPGGTIALALHTRLLFRQSDAGQRARHLLFQTLDVSGILNGAALAATKVWPSHHAPFCLLFATNQPPTAQRGVYFISPVSDATLNHDGHFRIDPSAAQTITHKDIANKGWLLKTLYRGTTLDVGVMQQITSAKHPSIAEYCDRFGLARSRGFQDASERTPPRGSTAHLQKLRVLSSVGETPKQIDVKRLPKWDPARKVAEPRTASVFEGPLVLTFEAPRHDATKPRAIFSPDAVAYTRSFYGISTHGHREPLSLAKYLLILCNSSLVLYYALMRSSMFGAERNKFQLQDILDFPLVPYEELAPAVLRDIDALARSFLDSEAVPLNDVDRLVSGLLGLSNWDMQVVSDSMATALPFQYSQARAQGTPSLEEKQTFSSCLRDVLEPMLHHVGRRVSVTVGPHYEGAWQVLEVRTAPLSVKVPPPQDVLPDDLARAVWGMATEAGACRVMIRGREPGHLVIGIFAQYRYWTATQARILAADLLGDVAFEAWLLGTK